MVRTNKILILLTLIVSILSVGFSPVENRVGDVIDEVWGVPVYFNGKVSNVSGRHMTSDGYNLGLKYQCVEFVKRFYYEIYNHRMPNSYGHAKEFFDMNLPNGTGFNAKRGLQQYKNVGKERPQAGDILVYGPQKDNRFGHVGIIAEVHDAYIILAQQNYGRKTRQKLMLKEYMGIYTVVDYDIRGWLRMP